MTLFLAVFLLAASPSLKGGNLPVIKMKLRRCIEEMEKVEKGWTQARLKKEKGAPSEVEKESGRWIYKCQEQSGGDYTRYFFTFKGSKVSKIESASGHESVY